MRTIAFQFGRCFLLLRHRCHCCPVSIESLCCELDGRQGCRFATRAFLCPAVCECMPLSPQTDTRATGLLFAALLCANTMVSLEGSSQSKVPFGCCFTRVLVCVVLCSFCFAGKSPVSQRPALTQATGRFCVATRLLFVALPAHPFLYKNGERP